VVLETPRKAETLTFPHASLDKMREEALTTLEALPKVDEEARI